MSTPETVQSIPTPTSQDNVAVQVADKNVQKVLAVLMDPHDPRYDNPLF